MEMKTKILDKKHILIISIAILSIIISYFNITFAFFSDTKNQPISIKSAATFGEYTVHEPNVYIEGKLTYTTDKTNMLSVKNIEVVEPTADTYDFLLTVATQIDPRNTEYKDNEYSYISYEIYHKTSNSIDTTNATCTESKYTNESGEDICSTGTYIENSLNGLPFELIKDYKITDTNTHYFDIYIYLNNETAEEKNIKTRIFYLDKGVEKQINYYTDSLLEGNDPDLKNSGLVPVRYLEDENGNWNWTIINPEEKWYDYEKQEWANAVSLAPGVSKEVGTKLTVPDGTSTDSDILAMFVWIPRFSYTIGCTSSTSCYGYKVDKASNLAESTPGAIDIKFVDKDTNETYTGDSPTYTYTSEADRNPTNYYTHPAFNFGNDKLTGIWVGKFETSVNPSSDCYTALINKIGASSKCKFDYKNANQEEDVTPRILPNVLSLVYQNVYNEFETAKKFASNTMYGLTNKTDSHMMKNSEWGAVVYLSQSIYGKYGNQNYEGTNKEIYKNDSGASWARYTGRSQRLAPATDSYSEEGTYKYDDISTTDGTKVPNSGTGASTTGNIYGIYDMVGGAYEYVMGYYTEASSVFGGRTNNGTESDSSGFKDKPEPDAKYFDGYKGTIEGETKSIDLFTRAPEVIGHATAETKRWYSDSASSISASYPWVIRGGYCSNGSLAGAFYSLYNSGDGFIHSSFRSVLATIE